MHATISQGASQDVVDRELSGTPLHARADALNKLLSNRRIQLFNANNVLVYKEVTAEEAAKWVLFSTAVDTA